MTERLIKPADIEVTRRIHEFCGTGPIRDRNWWELESAAVGSNWTGLYATRIKLMRSTRRWRWSGVLLHEQEQEQAA